MTGVQTCALPISRALKLARELVATRPMPLGYDLLVNCLLEAEREAEALAVMEKARAAGKASDSLRRQLGLTLTGAGRTTEAITVLQPLADAGDLDALNALAVAHSEAGRQREAFETLHQEGGQVFNLSVHPWLMGVPHRIKYLDEALRRIERFGNVWHATPGEIARHYMDTMMG